MEFIEKLGNDQENAQVILDMCTKDLQQALVMILEVLPRQNAIGALEIYHEHDQFRQKLIGFYDAREQTPIVPTESDFPIEEEKLTLD